MTLESRFEQHPYYLAARLRDLIFYFLCDFQGYSGAGWDPRTSSAFSPLQPPQAPVAHKTSSAHGFDLKGFEQKSASNFEQKAPGFDLKGFDQKGGQGFEPSVHFGAKASTQSAVQQDMKGGFISLARWENQPYYNHLNFFYHLGKSF